MSIFESKEFWSTKIGNEEEFDSNSILIGNLDNEIPSKDKIAVSSFQGYLRIYEPYFGDYKIENLLFERNYSETIKQIGLGSTIINSNDKQLIMIIGKRLTVHQFYNLRTQVQVRQCFEHKLIRVPFNFCIGSIGDKKNDMIFVQSVDGVVSIIEQDNVINNIEIYEMILPGCIAFVSSKDSLVLSTPSYEIECYSYNNLVTTKSKGKSSDAKLYYDWTVNLGELTKGIQVINNTLTKKQDIALLTETMLYLISESGQVLFHKRLDFEPISFHIYSIEDKDYQLNKQINNMQMFSSHMNHVFIYKGPSLSWVFKVNDTPVFISRAEFDSIKGLIITLSDNGVLSILYLGMETHKNNKIILPVKNYNPDKIINETDKLIEVIRTFEKGVVSFPKEFLDVKVEVSSKILSDENYQSENIYLTDVSGKIQRIQAKIDLIYEGKVADKVKINVISPYNIVCDEPIITVGSVASNEIYSKIVNFRVIKSFFPIDTQVKVYVTYEIKHARSISDKGTKSNSIYFHLPIAFLLKASQGKNSNLTYKVTISTDKDRPVEMRRLFEDVDCDIVKSSQLSVSFILPNEVEVEVASSSKGNGKYRIQSSAFEGLVLLTRQVVSRLEEVYSNKVIFCLESEIEYEKYFEVISNHHRLFSQVKEGNTKLDEYSSLYTTIQKSILSKYKEKTPPKLNNLDFLLNHVHSSMITLVEDLNETVRKYKVSIKDIVAWTEGMIMLVKLKAKLNEEQYFNIKDTFPLDNIENLYENSWVDVTLANMTNFFKFYFNKSNETQEIKEVKEFEKWKKYFKSLFEKIIKKEGF